MLKDILLRPYPLDHSHYRRVSNALIFGFFVFVFLFILQPFQLDDWNPSLKVWYIAGYGAITTCAMLLFSYLLPIVFPRFFTETSWNVGKEIVMALFHILVIASLNMVYSHAIGIMELSLSGYIRFVWITLLVAIFPVSFFTLLNYNRLLRKHIREAGLANRMVQVSPTEHSKYHQRIVISSENQHESIELSLQQLLFIQSADNYVEVVYTDQQEIIRKLIRNTLKRLTPMLAQYSSLYRCHRSYLVNLIHVEKVSGNALGLKLHLKGYPGEIPVSRSLNHEIEEKIRQAR